MFVRLCVRNFGSAVKQNHYEVLGVQKGATQGEIKSAYYKLSSIFHPDKGMGDNSKFQEIAKAYEVIGNPKTRQMYDMGAFGLIDSSEIQMKPRVDDQYGPTSAQISSRAAVHDFDERMRAHYKNSFARGQRIGMFEKWRLEGGRHHKENEPRIRVIVYLLSTTCLFFWLLTEMGIDKMK